MRVIICGSTHWNYNEIVSDEVIRLRRLARDKGEKLLVITGGEPGPETVAEEACKQLAIDYIIHPAIKVLGNQCFTRRNELMLKYHSPDLVIGVSHNAKQNRVIYDLLTRAQLKGIKTKLIDYQSIQKSDEEIAFNPHSK